jgi:hypothetical protein
MTLAAKTALATAGATGVGEPAVPPVGVSVVETMRTSTSGISFIRSTGSSWKLLCATRPFFSVISP